MSLIKVRDLAFGYDEELVLDEVSFDLNPGEFVILTGENGSAKSTLIKNILGLLKPAKGTVEISKNNSQGEKLVIGYLSQTITSFNAGFPSTVKEFVASGRYPQNRWFKRLDANDWAHVESALEAVDVLDLVDSKIGELSGGQKQRINLARVIAMDPDIYVLDEPTTGMDKKSRIKLYDQLKYSSQVEGKTILMITHADEELEGKYDRHLRLVRMEETPWRCFTMISSKKLL